MRKTKGERTKFSAANSWEWVSQAKVPLAVDVCCRGKQIGAVCKTEEFENRDLISP